MKKQIKDYLALALDNVSDKTQLQQLIKSTCEYIGVYKIGLEQFIRFGPEVFKYIRNIDNKIFLDLKLNDIPNTVSKAVTAAAEHSIDYLTIHTMGGLDMMKAAVQATKNSIKPPKLIGVTVLTSVDKNILNNEMKIAGTITGHVAHLANLAVSAQLDGIVCSAVDLPAIKQYLPDKFEIITPGIRPSGIDSHDQKRVMTPKQAIKNGSTLLVIGRAITKADDPQNAARNIFESINSILN